MAPKVLMCRPDYFGIEYEINPWMNKKKQPDKKLALEQWLKLTSALSLAGAELNFIAPQEGLPDMVFTANAGLIYRKQIILSNFRPEQRRGEVKFFREWFLAHGYIVSSLPSQLYFEGHGDALFMGDKLICGHGFRSDIAGIKIAAASIEKNPTILRLTNEDYYHLDTCFCPIRENLILYYPEAFDEESVKKIERLGETIAVSSYDARHFVCNAVPIDNKFITAPMSKILKKRLEKHSVELVEVNLLEFLKSGGGARCLTLFTD